MALTALGLYAALTLFALYCLLDQEDALVHLEFGSRYGSNGEPSRFGLYVAAGLCLFAANLPIYLFAVDKLVPEPPASGLERTRADRFRAMLRWESMTTTDERVGEHERRQKEHGRKLKAQARARRARERDRDGS